MLLNFELGVFDCSEMKYINRYAACLFSIFGLYYFFNFIHMIFVIEKPDPSNEIVEDFESLKVKIDYLQNLVNVKQNDIDGLKNAFSSNVNYYNNLVEKQKKVLDHLKNNSLNFYGTEHKQIHDLLSTNSSNLSYNDQVRALLSKLNQNKSQNSKESLTDILDLDVDFPKVIEFLPHLIGKTHLIQPKFKLTKNRIASMVIGIPTIKREKTSYLLETLKSVFDAMNELEKSEALIVVMIAEMDDQAFVQGTIELLTKQFKFETESGLLEIIVPSSDFYPDLSKIGSDVVFHDSTARVKWRTKQNYDFSYLMTYAQKRGKYYLQIEDDVISKSGFFTTIVNFIKEQQSDKWLMMEFSQLGFIGKLFKCKDLPKFVNFFLIFAVDKPVDWLYESLLDVKICNPEKGNNHCERSKSSLKIKYKPSLFQHVGVYSSLKGKTQKLKDKEFGKQILIRKHNNPKAKVSTSLKVYMKYTLESAYLGQNYFWSMAPDKNSYINFEFYEPTKIYKYYIKSGNPEHPDDKLYNATFQVKPEKPIELNNLPDNYKQAGQGFYMINRFSNALGMVSGTIDPNITGKISQIRIIIPFASETWIILSEIEFATSMKN